MNGLVPDVTCVGDNSFWGENGGVTQLKYSRAHVTIGICRFPTGFFAGNYCVLSPGDYPSDCLVGVNTFAPPHLVRKKLHARRDEPATWFGSPAFRMPTRKAQNDRPNDAVDPALTPDLPTLWEYAQRCVMMEFAEILFQVLLTGFDVMLVYTAIPPYPWMEKDETGAYVPSWADVPQVTLAMVLVVLVYASSSLLLCILLKRLMTGPTMSVLGKLGSDALFESSLWTWSARWIEWFWYNDDRFLAPMNMLLGDTLAANSIIRRPMGCKIGARTLLLNHGWTNMDCVVWGSDCVYSDQKFQLHTYEDRRLKVGTVTIGDRCSLVHCTAMALSVIGDGVTVTANSCVSKGEELSSGAVYSGIPTSGNRDATAASKRFEGRHPAPDLSQDRSCMALTAEHI